MTDYITLTNDQKFRSELADIFQKNAQIDVALTAIEKMAARRNYPPGISLESVAMFAQHEAGIRKAVNMLRTLMSEVPDKPKQEPVLEDIPAWGALENDL